MNLHDHIATHRTEYGFRTKRVPNSTSAQPGSSEKVSVMTARVENGEQLFSDEDLTVLPDRLELCWRDYQQVAVNWRQVIAREPIRPDR